MKHASSLEVFAHWNERRGHAPAPSRSDIDPAAIRRALGDVFLLSADFIGASRFRLAGTRLCALFGRELKGQLMSSLFSEAGQGQFETLLSSLSSERMGAVAGVTGISAEGARLELELLLLPLSSVGHARIRALGSLAPLHMPYWAGVTPLTQLDIGSVRRLGGMAANATTPQFMAVEGTRIRHGFVVHDGGLSTAAQERAG